MEEKMNNFRLFLANIVTSFLKGSIFLSTCVKTLFKFLNDNSGALMAIGTVALVIVTFCHMDEARKMREETQRLADSTTGQLEESAKMRLETKRLADITVQQLEESKKMRLETKRMADLSVEQFKIRSFPSFLVKAENPVFENGEVLQSFRVHNKGDITAFQTTTISILTYVNNENTLFRLDSSAIYEYGGRKTTVDVEDDFLRDTIMTIISRLKIPQGYIPDDLKNALFFIKFKVPYDEKYRYRQYAYYLQKDVRADKKQEKVSIWNPMGIDDTKKIINKFMTAKELSPEVTRMKGKFFIDYKIE